MPVYLSAVYVAKDLSTNASLITTPPFLMGDYGQVAYSCSTQSNAAINIQVSNADGLQSEIPENSWINLIGVTGSLRTGVIPAGYRWSRVSTPAASNSTIIFSARQ